MIRPTNSIFSLEKFILTERPAYKKYLFAIGLSISSLFILSELISIDNSTALLSMAFLNVVISAMYGGKAPALVDSALTAIGIDYFFSKPIFRTFDSAESFIRITILGLVAYLVASLVSALRAQYLQMHQMNSELEQQKKDREHVLAYVSHDLRTPLSAISFGTEFIVELMKRGASPEKVKKQLSIIERACLRMNRLIADLLDASKAEGGTFQIVKKSESIFSIINECLDDLHPTALIKNIKIKANIEPGIKRIECDRNRLIQVILNLTGNAIKFSPENSKLEITIKTKGNSVILEVKDYGPGIDANDLPHIFDRYWQNKDTSLKGTGLGLFISKSIIEAHNGHIQVESSPQGTTFSVYLPYNPKAVVPSQIRPNTTAKKPAELNFQHP